ncbi:S8 family serine peptidase [Acetivibrio cellulolyticus]|uniref:S8 family serine peptidase n=1 Tax=Acetivibrio cellulolyticus TaxID=35830 RepID=UPI0001E2DE24|nr:S8 family serine peptidase [Acetivibrio cellulolyticus]
MLDIAIIDDGINEGLYCLNSLKYNIEITQNLEIITRDGYDKYSSSHATICAAIIKKFAPEASISSVKILNDKRRCLCKQLIKAIEWCIAKTVKIVNLSLGTIYFDDYPELLKIINYAAKEGVIIIAACSNQRVMTYPSSCTNVIGVKTDFTYKLKGEGYIYNFYPYDGIDITSCSVFDLVKYNGGVSRSDLCNSYATPFITAKVYEIVKGNPYITVDGVKAKLIDGSVNRKDKTEQSHLIKNVDWVEKALLINLNNLTIQLPKYNHNYKIVDQINLKCDCYCSAIKNIRNLLDETKRIIVEFDTVILNANNFACVHEKCASEDLLNEIISRGKNVVYLDDNEINKELKLSGISEKTKIWHPSIFNYLDNPATRSMGIPLICVNDFMGDKLMELLDELGKKFRNDKYNVVLASDTCIGNLFGINYSPLFNRSKFNKYDPARLQTLCGLYNPDVIIYGINAISKDFDYFKYKNSSFEVDIEIVITENYDEINKFINFCWDKNSQLALLIPEKSFRDKELCTNKNITIFDLCSKSFINDLYKYIISFYNDN